MLFFGSIQISSIVPESVVLTEEVPLCDAVWDTVSFWLSVTLPDAVWCSVKLPDEGSDTVFTERLDQYLIARGDGQEPAWLQIPICGFFVADTSAKSIVYWKDYFDYRKYKEQVTRLFGEGFSLFRETLRSPPSPKL